MNIYESYVIANANNALNTANKFGINILVPLAQGAMESGWGTSKNVKDANNFFGMTVGSGKTNEYWDGKFRTAGTGLKMRIYSSAQNSFDDFARLIKNNYKAAYAVNNDLKAYAKAIAYSPYISESNGDNRPLYEKGIINNANIILDIAKKKELIQILKQIPA